MLLRVNHFIFSFHGFALPKDPRTPWPLAIDAFTKLRYGKAGTSRMPRTTAMIRHDQRRRLPIRAGLRYPPVQLNGHQAHAAARGFMRAIVETGLPVHALSILPDHAHLVLSLDEADPAPIADRLKQAVHEQLELEQMHPLAKFASPQRIIPSLWIADHWSLTIPRAQDVYAAIRLVESAPMLAGFAPQPWRGVTPFSPVREADAPVALAS